jgi:hypothetical protein
MWIDHTTNERNDEMSEAMVKSQENAMMSVDSNTMEALITKGDLSGLNTKQKTQYYVAFCQRLGLDPATQPFKVLKLQGKEVLYADRGCAQQLNNSRGISHQILSREVVNGCYVVTARAMREGRSTDSIGAVPVENLKGESLCNAFMKAETKAKRRSTLDLVGLGVLDESEVGSIPNAAQVDAKEWQNAPMPEMKQADAQVVEEPPKTTVPSNVTDQECGECVVHFGKTMKDKRLNEIQAEAVAWLVEKWEVKPYNGKISPKDTNLKECAVRYLRYLKGLKVEQPKEEEVQP